MLCDGRVGRLMGVGGERLPPPHAAALEPLGTLNHAQANEGHEETKQEGQYTALVRIVAIDPPGAPSIQARVVEIHQRFVAMALRAASLRISSVDPLA
jgi:hypothetical protein